MPRQAKEVPVQRLPETRYELRQQTSDDAKELTTARTFVLWGCDDGCPECVSILRTDEFRTVSKLTLLLIALFAIYLVLKDMFQ